MKENAFKVTATKGKKNLPVAEYIFNRLKEAIKFELGMREKGYNTEIERINY